MLRALITEELEKKNYKEQKLFGRQLIMHNFPLHPLITAINSFTSVPPLHFSLITLILVIFFFVNLAARPVALKDYGVPNGTAQISRLAIVQNSSQFILQSRI